MTPVTFVWRHASWKTCRTKEGDPPKTIHTPSERRRGNTRTGNRRGWSSLTSLPVSVTPLPCLRRRRALLTSAVTQTDMLWFFVIRFELCAQWQCWRLQTESVRGHSVTMNQLEVLKSAQWSYHWTDHADWPQNRSSARSPSVSVVSRTAFKTCKHFKVFCSWRTAFIDVCWLIGSLGKIVGRRHTKVAITMIIAHRTFKSVGFLCKSKNLTMKTCLNKTSIAVALFE